MSLSTTLMLRPLIRVFAVASLALGFVAATTPQASAAPVTFDLRGQSGTFDGNTTAMFTVMGLTGTFTSMGGTLNSNGGQFGIDSPVTGEDSDGIEAAEILQISFSQDVEFTQLDLQGFGGTETAIVTIGSNSTLTLTDNGFLDVFDFTTNNALAAGEVVEFAGGVGTYGISTFTVNTVTAVPEPATLWIAAAGIGCVVARRRRGIHRDAPKAV